MSSLGAAKKVDFFLGATCPCPRFSAITVVTLALLRTSEMVVPPALLYLLMDENLEDWTGSSYPRKWGGVRRGESARFSESCCLASELG